jgi:hypothetical protein
MRNWANALAILPMFGNVGADRLSAQVIRDDQGKGEEQVLEGWEAWRRGKGGEVVCRVG